MFNLGGIVRSLVNPATLLQLATGPAGWASLALRTLAPQIGMNVIQRLGQQMGLPQAAIDLSQAAFANSIGRPDLMRQEISQVVRGVTQQMDLRPSQAGQLERELLGASDRTTRGLNDILEGFAMRQLREVGGDGAEQGGSILMRIARALGQLMDQKMNELATKADELGRIGQGEGNVFTEGDNAGGLTGQGQGQFGQLSAEVQALSQELSYLSQAVSSTIKGIGEAASTVARK